MCIYFAENIYLCIPNITLIRLNITHYIYILLLRPKNEKILFGFQYHKTSEACRDAEAFCIAEIRFSFFLLWYT